jgi:hypothetical protein
MIRVLEMEILAQNTPTVGFSVRARRTVNSKVRSHFLRWPADLISLFLFYQSSFNPSCTWRELVAVDVMTPAVGEGPPVAAA